MNESLNPINLLKEDMENDEIAIRVNAIHRLKLVATLVSQDDIRNTLLPYLDGK
jgi:serine/threonine-protein phosphatase 2A regulatory subunit A